MSDKANICVLCGQNFARKTATGAEAVLEVSDTEECEALHPSKTFLVCSREPGHPGDHAACGFIAHPASTWSVNGEPIR